MATEVSRVLHMAMLCVCVRACVCARVCVHVVICSVEINEDDPKHKKQGIYSELAITRKTATITYIWQRVLEEVGTVGKLSGEKGKPSGIYDLIVGCWHGQAG